MNYIDQRKELHFWQLFVVAIGVVVITLLDMFVPLFNQQLIATPYLLMAVLVALYGDYYSGLVAILLSTIGVAFIGSDHLQNISAAMTRSIEFLAASTIIYYLAWRSRDLTRDTASLSNTVIRLQNIAKKQSKDAKIDKKNLAKLQAANRELLDIVDVVMDDKSIWASSVKNEIDQTDKLSPNPKTLKNTKSS